MFEEMFTSWSKICLHPVFRYVYMQRWMTILLPIDHYHSTDYYQLHQLGEKMIVIDSWIHYEEVGGIKPKCQK